MAISKILRDLIKKQCGELKYKDEKLDEFLFKIYDSHEAKEVIQANNVDLVKQREEHKQKLTELKTQLSDFTKTKNELEQTIETLKKSDAKLTPEQQALLDKGMSKEVEGLINTLNEKVNKSDEAFKLLTDQLKVSAEETKAAKLKARREGLNSSLTTALNGVNINDTQKLKTALALINSGDMAKVKDDNTISYGYQEDGKPFTFDNEKDLAKYIAENHQYLVSPSKNQGGGSQYLRGNGSPNPFTAFNGQNGQNGPQPPMTLQQMRNLASSELDKHFNS